MEYLGYTHEILVGTTREQAYDRGYQIGYQIIFDPHIFDPHIFDPHIFDPAHF